MKNHLTIFLFIVPIMLISYSCDSCKEDSILKTTKNKEDLKFQIELIPETDKFFSDQEFKIKININSKEIEELKVIGENKTPKQYRIKDIRTTYGRLSQSCKYIKENYLSRELLERGQLLPYWPNEDGLQLFFDPTSHSGPVKIELTLADEDCKEVESTVVLDLDVKSSFVTELSVRGSEDIFSNQDKPIRLNISSQGEADPDHVVYTVKNVETSLGRLQFPNGDLLQEGSILKHGSNDIILKVENTIKKNLEGQTRLTIANENGCERNAELNFKIRPVNYDLNITEIDWDHKPYYLLDNSNDYYIRLAVKIVDPDNSKKGFTDLDRVAREFGSKSWNLISSKSSDGSPLTVNNFSPFSSSGTHFFSFKLDEIKLEVPTEVIFTIEGPCHITRELSLSILPEMKAKMFGKKISHLLEKINTLNKNIQSVYGSNCSRGEARELSKQAGSMLRYCAQASKQIRDFNTFANQVEPETMDNIDAIYIQVQMLQNSKQALDSYYGF